MKRKFTFLLQIFSILLKLDSVSQNWLLAKQSFSTASQSGNCIAVDNRGNIYFGGSYQSLSYFDGDTVSCLTFGNYFISKYNSSGNLIWLKTGGGVTGFNNDPNLGVKNIAIDNLDNIYITGGFVGSCFFDTFSLSSYGSSDIFIAKYDTSGNCLWAKNAGGTGYDAGYSLVNSSSFLYLTGVVDNSTSLHFDSINKPSTNVSQRCFIAKFNSFGSLIWVNTTSGPGKNQGYDISVINSSIYVCGGFDSTSTFDNESLTSSGHWRDIYILKYDTSCNSIWSATVTEPNFGEAALSISNDNLENCYVTGYFSDTATFGDTTLHSSAVADGFIAKYKSSGNLSWVKQFNSSNEVFSNWITTDSIGNSYITGEFQGTVTFGNTLLTSTSNLDMFISKYDSGGTCVGVKQVGNATGKSITLDSQLHSYIAGSFLDTTYFDSFTLINGTQNIYNAFWAKLDKLVEIQEVVPGANNHLMLYPNPSRGNCTVEIPFDFLDEKKVTLTILDMKARVIQQKTLNIERNKLSLPIHEHAKGACCIILSNGKKSYCVNAIFE